MIYIFVPDLFKTEEAFEVEAPSLQDAIKKVNDECPLNWDLAIYRKLSIGLIFLGVVEYRENKRPKLIKHIKGI